MEIHRAVLLTKLFAFALLVSLVSIANAQKVPPRITQAVDNERRVILRGNTYPLARPEYDRGAAPDSLPMERMLLVLTRSREQEAALTTLLDEQQDKSSPNFHRWLTPEQFGQQFGPADADIQAVVGWLSSQGFLVNNVAKGRTVIEFSGDAGLVRNAFHTQIHKYVVDGEEHWANVSEPQIPVALAPIIGGIDSLNNFPRSPMHHFVGTFSRSKATGEVTPLAPLFTYPGCGPSPISCFAVGPYDFATIYNVLPLWNAGIDGTGQTVAIVARTNISIQDVRDFRNLFGLPAKDPRIIVNGPDPGITSVDEEREADLDVQWSGAVAKNATIDLVVSASTNSTDGSDLSAQFIVENNLAPIMSMSFGQCEFFLGTSGNMMFNQLWQRAAAQGITVFVAAGDQGSAGCDNHPKLPIPAISGLEVNGLAATPFNVAVGGTDFNDFKSGRRFGTSRTTPPPKLQRKGIFPKPLGITRARILSTFGSNPEANCNDPNFNQISCRIVAEAAARAVAPCPTSIRTPGRATYRAALPPTPNHRGRPATACLMMANVTFQTFLCLPAMD